jgi:hypothetical protein
MALVPALAPTTSSTSRRALGAAPRVGRSVPAWLCGALVAALLSAVYLLISPPSGDLAAATYRSNLFAHAGFAFWDDGWYAGHSLPAYSLLAPALGAWLGVRTLLALSAVAAATLFGLLAPRWLPDRAGRAAALTFAFGFCAELPSGRVPYDLGVAIGLAAVLAMILSTWSSRHRTLMVAAALALSITTSAASPVAGAFLALVCVALAISAFNDSKRADPRLICLACAAAALATILLLALTFPEGGYEPFSAGAFWPELAAAVAIAALLPQGGLSTAGRRTVRFGAGLYAVALLASFIVQTPVGSNVTRLGAMFGAPVVVGVLWTGAGVSLRRRADAGRLLLFILAPLLLYWQLATAIDDQVALAGDPTVHASFYEPLRAELLRRSHGDPIRVEVPMTNAHWESVYLPGGPISIARGWERQLDTRYDALFYHGGLTTNAYRRWLDANAIAYVALPDAKLDSAGQQERRLIDRGLPYLQQVWHSSRWRLFAVRDATPLAQAPAQMLKVGADSFTLQVPHPGSYEVRMHWTPYWALVSPAAGCVSAGPDGFTEVQARTSGRVHVEIRFGLDRVFSQGPRCAS